MAVATHCIWGAYGFWLPNDPRGSGSNFVGSYKLWQAAGNATPVDSTHSVAHQPHDRTRRLAAKVVLQKPPMLFTAAQIAAIVQGFTNTVTDAHYIIYACAIMPDHVHVVLGHDEFESKKVVTHLKSFGTKEINRRGLNPYKNGQTRDELRIWADRSRFVFLRAHEIPGRIKYVEENPLKAGLPRQSWPFLHPYP